VRPPVRTVAVIVALLVGACYGSDTSLTESGKGRPELTIEFPSSVEPGSTHTAVLAITNPGPGDIGTLLVDFRLVGGVDNPLISAGAKSENPSVAGVEPEPSTVSADGIVYHFEGLAEGESTTIEFDLVVPETLGVVGNSVVVSDAAEIDRARGVLLQTTVER